MTASARRSGVAALLLLTALGSGCSAKKTPFQASFVQELQLFSRETQVNGFRLGFLDSDNARVVGLDVSAAGTKVGGDLAGAQIGLVNRVGGSARGVQISGFLNRVGDETDSGRTTGAQLAILNQGNVRGAQLGATNAADQGSGVQIGLFNLGSIEGLQLGAFNGGDEPKGLQLGIINTAKELSGLQVGVINLSENGFLPIFPLVNFHFD